VRPFSILLILSALLPAQTPPSLEQEQRLLQQAVSEVGNSPVEFIRAAERHLRRHPNSLLRAELERAVLKAAIDSRDIRRTIEYGEKVLARGDDAEALERVVRALLTSEDPASARRAIPYAERLQKIAGGQAMARALVLLARAQGVTGEPEKALALASQGFEKHPTAEAAAELARWQAKLGRHRAALENYAVAFSIADAKSTPDDRARFRKAMGELAAQLGVSAPALGELVLKGYDRTAEKAAATTSNQDLQDAFEFRLSGLRGDSLRLADLRGKVIVLDFWATWCAPCRVQHPMLEQLERDYKDTAQVVFVSINADQDRTKVKPFLEETGWSDHVYFEDGLARFYRISSIPTTIIFNKHAELAGRIPGFSPQTYLTLLKEKIEEARRE